MADQSDVADALMNLISAKLYPTGVANAAAVSSAGYIAEVITGWPEKQHLDAMMKAGRVVVSVFSPPGMEKTVPTVSNGDWRPKGRETATYTIAIAGQTITVGGAAPTTYFRQNVAAVVNGVAYVVTATAGQTALQVAAALLVQIQVDWPAATSLGAVLTLPDTAGIEAVRVGTVGYAVREVRRQIRAFSVNVWAPDDASRRAVAKAVDLGLTTPRWMDLGDLTDALLIYISSHDVDDEQSQGIYRREFTYTAQYSTVEMQTQVEIVSFRLDIAVQDVVIKTEVA